MKVAHEVRRLQTSGAGEVQRAQILATPGMFKILADKLYTQKELAVVRELLANAWDAHVAAGTTDTPIDIHLPTIAEPWFEIRDYGTGLPLEGIRHLYDYGSTTKDQSSDFIGGLGIGSKAPFAVTDQFTVTSIHNGVKHVHSVFLDETGAPCSVAGGQIDTIEPPGLCISVPIDFKSFSKDGFEDAIAKLYRHVPTPPKLNLSLQKEMLEPEYDHVIKRPGGIEIRFHKPGTTTYRRSRKTTPGAWHYQTARVLGGCGATVIMGLIPYDVPDPGTVFDDLHKSAAREVFGDPTYAEHFGGRAIEIRVPIDTVTISASRENIESTGANTETLRTIMRDALTDLMREEKHKFDSSDCSFYEWCDLAIKLGVARTQENVPAKFHKYFSKLATKVASHAGYEDAKIDYEALCKSYGLAVRGAVRYSKTRQAAHENYSRLAMHSAYIPNTTFVVKVQEKPTGSFHGDAERFYKDPATAKLLPILYLIGDIADARRLTEDLGFDHWQIQAFNPPKKAQRAKAPPSEDRLFYVSNRAKTNGPALPNRAAMADITAYAKANNVPILHGSKDVAMFRGVFIDRCVTAGILSYKNPAADPKNGLLIVEVPSNYIKIRKALQDDTDITTIDLEDGEPYEQPGLIADPVYYGRLRAVHNMGEQKLAFRRHLVYLFDALEAHPDGAARDELKAFIAMKQKADEFDSGHGFRQHGEHYLFGYATSPVDYAAAEQSVKADLDAIDAAYAPLVGGDIEDARRTWERTGLLYASDRNIHATAELMKLVINARGAK